MTSSHLANDWSFETPRGDTMAITRRAFLTAVPAVAVTTTQIHAQPQGTMKQSICSWCFTGQGEKWSLDKLCEVAVSLGVPSIELLGPKDFPTLGKHKLTCAIASNGMRGGFRAGFNNPIHRDELVEKTKATIDACAEAKISSVIGFVGMKWKNFDDPKSGEITREDAEKAFLEGVKSVALAAEKKGVTVCIEHLNSRDGSHPMTGHPGYQGDDLDWVCGLLRKVGSPRVKLLFDIYHVQIMHGDVIRRIGECKDLIGHVHTAGVPGRHELDATQELNYPPIIKALGKIGYTGYIGHEFIPTRKPLDGLKEAIQLCQG